LKVFEALEPGDPRLHMSRYDAMNTEGDLMPHYRDGGRREKFSVRLTFGTYKHIKEKEAEEARRPPQGWMI